MIRKFRRSDTEQVMQLWLSGNEDAHPFVPGEYWRSHYHEVGNALLQADVFVYDDHGRLRGFIGMINDYIAGIFVAKDCRSTGIGAQLLTYVKQKHRMLHLNVYQKNRLAASFYRREGFSVRSEQIDSGTGEVEYTMFWERGKTEVH